MAKKKTSKKKSTTKRRTSKKPAKAPTIRASKKKKKGKKSKTSKAKPKQNTVALPDELLQLARVPISGTYSGAMTSPNPNEFEIELRIDVDQSHTNSSVLNRVSWDLFQVFTSSGATWRVYIDSWIVEAPASSWGSAEVSISGSARSWNSEALTDASISIPWTNQSIGPAQLQLTDGQDVEQFACEWQSSLFRDVALRIDVCDSVDSAPLLPTYETLWHNNRPTDVVDRTLTIEESYAEAGIRIDLSPDNTVIDDSDPEFVSWTPSELHEAMVTHFDGLSDTPKWSLWGLMAGQFESSGVGGIMFDAASQFGGAGDAPERQGFALFRNHPWFDNLVDGAPTNQAQAQAARHFLYTWVHEAGHAFNHLHSWDKSRPDSLSWMNYDWKYDARNGADEFWNKFHFQFDNDELMHLRHGARNAVIMGGDSWASGGHLEDEHSSMAQLELVDGAPPVEVLLRSKELFQFMEPVYLELRLRNLTKKTIKVDSKLQPEFGVVAVLVKGPDGSVRQYDPLMCKLAPREQLSLSAKSKRETGADRHSEVIDLTFGKEGFYFDRPGQYSVRVVYQGADGTLIPSNLHRIRVGYPLTPDAERLAQDYFTHDVGLAIYLNGSQSVRLRKAMSVLMEVATRFSDQPIAAKTAAVVASAIGRPFFKVVKNKMKCTSRAKPEEALAITNVALASYNKSTSESLNLSHRSLVEQRAGYWLAMDEKETAKGELSELTTALELRGANPTVLKDVNSIL